MKDTSALIENNRDLWEQWTQLHMLPEADYAEEIARFRGGEIVLEEIERQELGDVAGKSILHLQCHFGLDTLSLARLGADVLGVDFSTESIHQAELLCRESDLQAKFLCGDIYDLPSRIIERFDIIYTSGGVLTWLPDLNRWAQVIARLLKPGGLFYIHEFHPFRRVIFPVRVDGTGITARYDYFSGEPVQIVERGSYSNTQTDLTHPAYYWVHGIGKIITALCDAGLHIRFLHELPKVYPSFPVCTHPLNGDLTIQILPDFAIPNAFTLMAEKPPHPPPLLHFRDDHAKIEKGCLAKTKGSS